MKSLVIMAALMVIPFLIECGVICYLIRQEQRWVDNWYAESMHRLSVIKPSYTTTTKPKSFENTRTAGEVSW